MIGQSGYNSLTGTHLVENFDYEDLAFRMSIAGYVEGESLMGVVLATYIPCFDNNRHLNREYFFRSLANAVILTNHHNVWTWMYTNHQVAYFLDRSFRETSFGVLHDSKRLMPLPPLSVNEPVGPIKISLLWDLLTKMWPFRRASRSS